MRPVTVDEYVGDELPDFSIEELMAVQAEDDLGFAQFVVGEWNRLKNDDDQKKNPSLRSAAELAKTPS